MHTNQKTTLRIALLVTTLFIPALCMGQATEQQKQVAALKQAIQQSLAGLRKYEWIETTTVLLKGEVKSQKQNRCYYGADGKIQKVLIGESAAPQQQSSGRRGGRLKSRVIAKKKEEMTEYMTQAVDLVHQYVPPNPSMIQESKANDKVAVESVEPGRVIRVSFNDFMKPGDLMSAILNIQQKVILEINVSTWLEDQQDGIVVNVAFKQLPDGTSYSGQTTLDAKSKDIKVVVENTGHRAL